MKKIISVLLFLLPSLTFADGFVQSNVIFNNAEQSSIDKVLLLNKKYDSVTVDNKTYYPVQARYIITKQGIDKIIEQITYSDVKEKLTVDYLFVNDF